MKNFGIEIKHIYADNLLLVTFCINWRMIVDVDFGA